MRRWRLSVGEQTAARATLAPPRLPDWNIGTLPVRTLVDTPIPITHWQLRHLMVYDGHVGCGGSERSGRLLFVSREGIDTLDLKTLAIANLAPLNYIPVSLDMNLGYIAASGQEGQLDVYAADSMRVIARRSTISEGDICNSVRIASYNNIPRIIAGCNDRRIQVFDIPSMHCLTTLICPSAVNTTCTSPDGKMMAVGTDMSEALLFNVQGTHYERSMTLQAASDAGFSCTFDGTGRQLAVGFQDGVVAVWDVRMLGTRLALLRTRQRRAGGAVRSVQYCRQGGLDLLAFSEHTGYVHVVDARTFATDQVVSVAETGQDIAGFAFTSSGLVAATPAGMVEIKLDYARRRAFPSGDYIE